MTSSMAKPLKYGAQPAGIYRDLLQAPGYLEDASAYTPERLKHGLAYAKQRLTRDLTPITAAFMKQYLEAYQNAVKSPNASTVGKCDLIGISLWLSIPNVHDHYHHL